MACNAVRKNVRAGTPPAWCGGVPALWKRGRAAAPYLNLTIVTRQGDLVSSAVSLSLSLSL